METLLVLGGAVAKSVLSLWLGKAEVVGDVAGVAVDTLVERVPNLSLFERRRAARQFARMAEAVAEKLAPFLETEFGGLPENERTAAVLAVADAMERASITSELLLTKDLDPLRLEASVRARQGSQRELLSGAGQILYDYLLREACNYTTEIAITLPPFASHAAQESLRRETQIIDLINTVLERLPEPTPAGSEGEEADVRFETQYRRTIARLLDRLELFGLDVSPFSKRYALSVAYITLSASNPAAETDTSAEDEYVRVDDALAGSRRMLVRGHAGSGKTTLLQWLAVTSARHRFEGRLENWNSTVPFLIQLRRHAGKSLPPPERFLDDITPSLTGAMPAGWIHRQLAAGRALVLIDGVDELPEDERPTARDWLLDLTESFNGSLYIVTSRATAASEDWLVEADFSHSLLQPMTLSDVESFIDHWHGAMRAALPDPTEHAELERLNTSLKGAVRSRPSLRSLATSPLLCAMLCALHRERSEQLPEDRMELYRVALEMLLERRDVERRIVGAERLPFREKQLLLRDFAYWLVLNNYIDADQATAIERVAHKLDSMPRVHDEPQTVFRHLLERSGVLRAPVEGRVDFVHRTFQEYLAAEEAVEQDHIGLLIENAHEDQWREVIVLAAGHSALRQREALLRGLLDRGNREPQYRHRLHLLAVACLETSPEVPAGLAAELREALAGLVPPKNMTEAQAVASAGELAVPLLAQFSNERARVAAACVRTLTLIGNEDALSALVPYGSDKRVSVAEELVRAWESFEPVEFARRVLAKSPLRHGRLHVRNREMLPALQYLSGLRRLRIAINIPLEDLELARSFPNLIELSAFASSNLSDLLPLASLAHLKSLDLHNCPAVSDLSPLANLTRLGTLTLSDSAVSDLSPLANLTQLNTLDLSGNTVSDVSPLAKLTKLHTLILRESAVSDLSPLANLTQLTWLNLDRCFRVSDVSPLANLTQMRTLTLSGSAVSDLSPLANLSQLDWLDLDHCTRVSDLSPLINLTQLSILDLSGTAVSDVSPLANLKSLRVVARRQMIQ